MAGGKGAFPIKNSITSCFSEVKYMCSSHQVENYRKIVLSHNQNENTAALQPIYFN
jgi:hypothetical protein